MTFNPSKPLASQRNSNVEMLRILIMFGILLWHITVHGFGLAHISGNMKIEHEFINSLCTALFAPCVNLFVLISGYYGMKFKASTLVRFEAQAVFYSFSITVLMFLLFDIMSVKIFIKAFIPVIGCKWWFLNTYLMLLILSPILNEGIAKLSKKQLLAIIVLLLILNGIGYLIRLSENGSNLQSFILIYIIGQFLRRYKDEYKIFTKRKAMLIACFTCTVMNLLIVYLCLIGGHYYPEITNKTFVYLSYSNPIIILQSVTILCFVLSFKPSQNNMINLTAKQVFAVYLITEAIGMPLYTALKDIFVYNFILGLFASVLIFIACIFIEMARNAAYESIIKRFPISFLLKHNK